MSKRGEYAGPEEGYIVKVSRYIYKTLLVVAFCFGLLPSVLKLYETSHW